MIPDIARIKRTFCAGRRNHYAGQPRHRPRMETNEERRPMISRSGAQKERLKLMDGIAVFLPVNFMFLRPSAIAHVPILQRAAACHGGQ